MSRLVERYPLARKLPYTDTLTDDAALLKLLEPYLDWVLAEIESTTSDILICAPDTKIDRKPSHVVLLSGRAVNVWLRHAGIRGGNV